MTRHDPYLDDQARGLRARFAAPALCPLALVSNPYVPADATAVALERLTAALALLGRRTLVIDAAESSPRAPEAAALDLAMCVESLSPDIWYLPARGLPTRRVDSRGSAARVVDEAVNACSGVDVVLVHAGPTDLARLLTRRALRPLLLLGEELDSLKHAYASMKLLAQRCEWRTADLMILADPRSPRVPQIASSLAQCADSFVGASVLRWTAVAPDTTPHEAPSAGLSRLVAAHLGGEDLEAQTHALAHAALAGVRRMNTDHGAA